MSLIEKLAGETAIYGLSSIVGRMLNYLLVFVYTRTLTEAENGILNELYAYAGFLIVVSRTAWNRRISGTAPRKKIGKRCTPRGCCRWWPRPVS